MTFLRHAVAAAAFGCVAFPHIAGGEILSTGEDTEKTPDPIVVHSPATSCRILWYHRAGGDSELDRLRALGYDITVVDAAPQLALANLLEYGTLVIAYTGPGFLAGRQPDIEAFVDQGGGLLVHQPNDVGALDYVPHGFDVTIANEVWCAPNSYFASIVDSQHPITSGCTDADLSGAFDTVGSLGPNFHVLAQNNACGDPALAVGLAGIGRVAFDTGNGNTDSVIPGTELYWDHVFGWLCSPGPIAVAPPTWGAIKAAYRN
jgi:hypothetical protein